MPRPVVFTIGHSTRSFADFVALLRAAGVTRLADIRAKPVSRWHPHFGRRQLEPALQQLEIDYRWFPELGGLRTADPANTANAGWKEDAFRAYADHMATPEFNDARAALEQWATAAPLAFMCAEADPLQCHRQLLADALDSRGWHVVHLVSASETRDHERTSFAVVRDDGRIEYPAIAPRLFP